MDDLKCHVNFKDEEIFDEQKNQWGNTKNDKNKAQDMYRDAN